MQHTLRADSVIWIASYPKSGNTWVQSVIRQAGKSHGFPSRDLDVYLLKSEKRSPEVVDGINPDVGSGATTVLKTHAAYTPGNRVHPELGLRTAGFVYVLRNPLDVLLSYINFTRLQYGKRRDSSDYQRRLFIDLLGFDTPKTYDQWAEMKLEDIPRENLDHALSYYTEQGTEIPGLRMTGGSWLNHCHSWITAAKELPSVVLKYEELLLGANAFTELTKLFTFKEDEILSAVEAVNQRQRDLQYKKVFYNKMSSYYFHEFFSPELIKEFLSRYESELLELGYDALYEPV